MRQYVKMKLNKTKGKVYPPGIRGIHKECPVHHCTGRETNWKPEPGLDPCLKEFRCIKGHAFYIAIYSKSENYKE